MSKATKDYQPVNNDELRSMCLLTVGSGDSHGSYPFIEYLKASRCTSAIETSANMASEILVKERFLCRVHSFAGNIRQASMIRLLNCPGTLRAFTREPFRPKE